jgi:3-oxoacyl-[acyl-carrier-protein] synthase-3
VLALLKEQSTPYLLKDDLQTVLEMALKAMTRAGCKTRHWCRPQEYCTDLGLRAARLALEDANLAPQAIEMIIFTGLSKAFVEPATAHVIKAELGAHQANAIDTQDACTSFVKSMELASALISSHRYRNVMIVCGERTFDFIDFSCKTVDEFDWKVGGLTIGDAAGAMILQASDDVEYVEDPYHWHFSHKFLPNSYALCTVGLNHPIGQRYRAISNARRLVRELSETVLQIAPETFAQEKFRGFQCDNLFVHEIGTVGVDTISESLRRAEVAIPETFRSFFPEYGNVASASLPLGLMLAKKENRLKPKAHCMYICPSAGLQVSLGLFKY